MVFSLRLERCLIEAVRLTVLLRFFLFTLTYHFRKLLLFVKNIHGRCGNGEIILTFKY